MKKLERQRKAKREAMQEDLERMKKGVDSKGQGFVEYELPPDEVSEEKVRRTMYTSMMTFIPFTNEYYEAMAAEDEMDDLQKMRIEQLRANDLYAQTKIGEHEEALESMMAETNYDFFYFNKLKMKMEAEGKFAFIPPDQHSFLSALDAGPRRNRLRKAIQQVYSFLDSSMTDELARMGRVGAAASGGGKAFDNTAACVWRGKDKNGDSVQCENQRLQKPVAPGAERKKKQKADYFQYCPYHVPFCVSTLHEATQQVKIRTPNTKALCAECYMLQVKTRPPPLSADCVPGVAPISVLKASQWNKVGQSESAGAASSLSIGQQLSGKGKKKKTKLAALIQGPKSLAAIRREQQEQTRGKDKAHNKAHKCKWQASPEEVALDENMRRFECSNTPYVPPKNSPAVPSTEDSGLCLWHRRSCVLVQEHRADDGPGPSRITMPNCYGMCEKHHLARHGNRIPAPPWPLPGMQMRRPKDFWKKHDLFHTEEGYLHWALPRVLFSGHTLKKPLTASMAAAESHEGHEGGVLPPWQRSYIDHLRSLRGHRMLVRHQIPPNFDVKEYIAPEEPETMVQSMGVWARDKLYYRRVRREGPKASVVVQRHFRGYRVRRILQVVPTKIDEKMLRKRLWASILIQSHMRCYLAVQKVYFLRILYTTAVTMIQSQYRGYLVRRALKRKWAAKRIVKFMKRLHFFKFRDAVILIMSLRRMFRKRHHNARELQRYYRGYRGRVFVFYQRLWGIITKSSARKIRKGLLDGYRRLIKWRKAQRTWVRPSSSELRERLTKRLCGLLTSHYRAYLARQEKLHVLSQAIKPIQTVTRAFLARCGAHHLAEWRQRIRHWLDRGTMATTGSSADSVASTTSHSQAGSKSTTSNLSPMSKLKAPATTVVKKPAAIVWSQLNPLDLILQLLEREKARHYVLPVGGGKHSLMSLRMQQGRSLGEKGRAIFKRKYSQSPGMRPLLSPTISEDGEAATISTGISLSTKGRSSGANSPTFGTHMSTAESRALDHPDWYIRKFVEHPYCFLSEIDYKKQFLPALHLWYTEDQHMSLLHSEQESLRRRFTNRLNNKLMIEVLDLYISQHPKPCRKHGRRVCGDCVYRRHCLLPQCYCPCYSMEGATKSAPASPDKAKSPTGKNGDQSSPSKSVKDDATATTLSSALAEDATVTSKVHRPGICVECDHPINLHAVVPLQCPKPDDGLLLELFGDEPGSKKKKKKRNTKKTATALLEERLDFYEEEEVRAILDKLRAQKQLVAKAGNDEDDNATTASGSMQKLSSLWKILHANLDPDMSMPIGVFGVDIGEVLVPKITDDDMREYREKLEVIAHRRAKRREQARLALTTPGSLAMSESSLAEATTSLTLSKGSTASQSAKSKTKTKSKSATTSLAAVSKAASEALVETLTQLQVDALTVHARPDYWEERGMLTLLPAPTDPVRTQMTHIEHDSHLPEPRNPEWAKADHPRFWDEIIAVNPNKRALDYEEGFAHNIPVPFLLPPSQKDLTLDEDGGGDHSMHSKVEKGAKQIVFTFEGGKVYFNLLQTLIRLAEEQVGKQADDSSVGHQHGGKSSQKQQQQHSQNEDGEDEDPFGAFPLIHPDNPRFLNLIINHIQICERHWRKFVADIRTGTLDRRLVVNNCLPKTVVDKYLSRSLPRPGLASQLDRCFRALGFHKKVLGKDIDIVPWVTKRNVREQRRIQERFHYEGQFLHGQLTEQEYALALQRLLISSRGGSRMSTRGGGTHSPFHSPPGSRPSSRQHHPVDHHHHHHHHHNDSANNSRPHSRSEHVPAEGDAHHHAGHSSRSPSRERSSSLTMMPTLNLGATSSRPGSGSGHSHSASHTAISSARGTADSPERARSAQGSPGKKRRGSTSQLPRTLPPLDPGSVHQEVETQTLKQQKEDAAVHALHYQLTTMPRDKHAYDVLHRLPESGYFICPFPACGASFLSPDMAFEHVQKVHRQQPRLYAATPESDAFLRHYWPRDGDLPWNAANLRPPSAHAGDIDSMQSTVTLRQLGPGGQKLGMPPGARVCPVPSCAGDVFPSMRHWEAHLRLRHRFFPLAHAEQGFWAPGGVDHKNSARRTEDAESAETLTHAASLSAMVYHARHGVLKTIPPDHSQPLFEDERQEPRSWKFIPASEYRFVSTIAPGKKSPPRRGQQSSSTSPQRRVVLRSDDFSRCLYDYHICGQPGWCLLPPDATVDAGKKKKKSKASTSSTAGTVSPTRRPRKTSTGDDDQDEDTDDAPVLSPPSNKAVGVRSSLALSTSSSTPHIGSPSAAATTTVMKATEVRVPLLRYLRNDVHFRLVEPYHGVWTLGQRSMLPVYCPVHRTLSSQCLRCLSAENDLLWLTTHDPIHSADDVGASPSHRKQEMQLDGFDEPPARPTHTQTKPPTSSSLALSLSQSFNALVPFAAPSSAASTLRGTPPASAGGDRVAPMYSSPYARPSAPFALYSYWTLNLRERRHRLQVLNLTSPLDTAIKDCEAQLVAESADANASNSKQKKEQQYTWLPRPLSQLLHRQQSLFAQLTQRGGHRFTHGAGWQLWHGDTEHVCLVSAALYWQSGVSVQGTLPKIYRQFLQQDDAKKEQTKKRSTGTDAKPSTNMPTARLQNARQWPALFFVRPVLLVQDRDEQGWLGCEVLFLAAQLIFGDQYNLVQGAVQPPTSAVAASATAAVSGPSIRLSDRERMSEVTPLLYGSLQTELVPASAIMAGMYRSEVSLEEDDEDAVRVRLAQQQAEREEAARQAAADQRIRRERRKINLKTVSLPPLAATNTAAAATPQAGRRMRRNLRSARLMSLLTTPESLLWLPVHCVEAVFPVAYISLNDMQHMRGDETLQQLHRTKPTAAGNKRPGAGGHGSDSEGDNDNNDNDDDVSLENEEDEAFAALPPLVRWQRFLQLKRTHQQSMAHQQQQQQQQTTRGTVRQRRPFDAQAQAQSHAATTNSNSNSHQQHDEDEMDYYVPSREELGSHTPFFLRV